MSKRNFGVKNFVGTMLGEKPELYDEDEMMPDAPELEDEDEECDPEEPMDEPAKGSKKKPKADTASTGDDDIDDLLEDLEGECCCDDSCEDGHECDRIDEDALDDGFLQRLPFIAQRDLYVSKASDELKALFAEMLVVDIKLRDWAINTIDALDSEAETSRFIHVLVNKNTGEIVTKADKEAAKRMGIDPKSIFERVVVYKGPNGRPTKKRAPKAEAEKYLAKLSSEATKPSA